MFERCSHIGASGTQFSNVGRDQHNVGGDQYSTARQTIVNVLNIPATAGPNEPYRQQDFHNHE